MGCMLLHLISVIFLFSSSLAIGTKTGYRLFSLSSVEQLDQVHESSKSIVFWHDKIVVDDNFYSAL